MLISCVNALCRQYNKSGLFQYITKNALDFKLESNRIRRKQLQLYFIRGIIKGARDHARVISDRKWPLNKTGIEALLF